MESEATVAEAITIKVSKLGHEEYRGYLAVKGIWGPYTKSCDIVRLTREDALEDAYRMKKDYIEINQLP